MSIEKNKQIAREFIETLHEGHFNLLADDGIFWVAGSTPSSGTKSKEEMIGVFSWLKSVTDDLLVMKIKSMTAEDDRVSVEASARLSLHNGRVYNNEYHILLVITDGKVASVREYSDTAHMLETFA